MAQIEFLSAAVVVVIHLIHPALMNQIPYREGECGIRTAPASRLVYHPAYLY